MKDGVVGSAVIRPSRPYFVTNSRMAASTSTSVRWPIISIPTLRASSTMPGISFMGLYTSGFASFAGVTYRFPLAAVFSS